MGKTDLLENLMQVAPLKLIVHKSAEALGEEVNAALVEARKKINKHNKKPLKNKATRKNGERSAKEIINRLDTIKKFI